jgi:hypothetical protein
MEKMAGNQRANGGHAMERFTSMLKQWWAKLTGGAKRR